MKDVFSLAGRKALVTGGSRGIGGAIVNPFSDHGAEVAFYHYRDEKNALQRVEKLREAGRAVHAIECDVSDEPKIAEMATWVGKNLGQVDILVNCAGIGGETPFPSITVGDWDRMLGVHLRGTFLVTRQFFEPMVSRSYGRIIDFSLQLAYKGGSRPGALLCGEGRHRRCHTRAFLRRRIARRDGQCHSSRPNRDRPTDGTK
jgi:3-oxoacyl-[acyl-carrier protein] reductase